MNNGRKNRSSIVTFLSYSYKKWWSFTNEIFGVSFLNWDMVPCWVQFAWLELFLRARYCVFCSAWTLSDPPVGVTILDTSGLKFKQCSFGWWDHCLATGEFLFLMWGIKVSYHFSLLKSSCKFLSIQVFFVQVCVNVRKARTFFDEARLIRYSIYNIALVNLTMLAFQ